MASIPSQWSNLPSDMLLIISERLDSNTDVLRLRAVCSSWRSSFQLSHPRTITSPLLSVKFPYPICPYENINPRRRGHFTLSQRTIYYVEPTVFADPNSSRGWIVHADKSQSGTMQLSHPFFRLKENAHLPKISSKAIKMLNFRVFEVGKSNFLEYVGDRENVTDLQEEMSFSTQDVATSDDAILTTQMGTLAHYNLGAEKWTVINDGQVGFHCESLLYRKGKFYAINSKGRMLVIDSSKNISAVEAPMRYNGNGSYRHLVESVEELYMVDKYDSNCFGLVRHSEEGDPSCTITFIVFKLDDNTKEWVRVTSLRDHAFFVGDISCFSVSTKQFPGCKKNCIYFTDYGLSDKENHSINNCVGIFDLRNNSVGPLSSFKRYSQIFWPPPTWLNLESSSKPSSRTEKSIKPLAQLLMRICGS